MQRADTQTMLVRINAVCAHFLANDDFDTALIVARFAVGTIEGAQLYDRINEDARRTRFLRSQLHSPAMSAYT